MTGFTYTPNGKILLADGRLLAQPVDVLGVQDLPGKSVLRPFQSAEDELEAVFREIPFAASQTAWMPFTGVTTAHRLAFRDFLRFGSPTSRHKMIPLRGEPGRFVMIAYPWYGGWKVPMLCAEETVMTVRMEDLIPRLPENRQQPTWRVSISRDPKPNETEGLVKEQFDGVAWDTRIRLICTKAGGAVVTIHPEN